MKMLRVVVAGCTFLLCLCMSAQADEKSVLGYLETVYVGDSLLAMTAKLDTGADTSSVYALDMHVERVNKQRWVRFRLTGDDGRTVRYRKRVLRFARIKLKSGGTVARPVVSFPVCVNGVLADAVVNLADRSEFDHPMLLGREYLASRIVVDPGQTFIAERDCSNLDAKS